jgi:DMSO reductase family type II enzyme molybdopterin subunit
VPQERSERPARSEDRYREQWRWDRVATVTHCLDCYPESCPFKAYVRDGVVLREEQSGIFPTVEPGVPDMNPAGCQKGVAWSQLLHAPERVLYPLRRIGERGEGKWQRVSWDEALKQVADGIIDAIQESGPDAVIHEGTPAQGGLMAGILFAPIARSLGIVATDVNANINDFGPGLYLTFGKFNSVGSSDDWFHSELVLITCANPVYTWMSTYHFIAEARYNGAEVVTIAPDCSPSTAHADYFVPVRPGADAALALSMCHVVVSERLFNQDFITRQTDLPLLVREDSRRFLRASDLEEGARDDQFFWLQTETRELAPAPRGTLDTGTARPALEGCVEVRLRDGSNVRARPVFELLRERLEAYAPERASAIAGVHPDVIRLLARKTARKRTNLLMGLTSGKYFHGDLIQRSWALLLALTGNWGRKGTGTHHWSICGFDGAFMFSNKSKPGVDEFRGLLAMQRLLLDAIKAEDPTMTDEMAAIEMMARMAEGGGSSPSAFFWYHHAGYADRWRRYTDPTMKRPFDDYVREASEQGWWKGVDRPDPKTEPRVLLEIGGNMLRRSRGGSELLLKHLWPKLRLVVSVDWRMSTTGMYSDVVLPAALSYEKLSFQLPMPRHMGITFCDRAVPPAGEAKPEWEIFKELARKIEQRAIARGVGEYVDGQGVARRMDGLYDGLTKGGSILTEDQVAEEMVRDTAAGGSIPSDTTLETLRERGYVRFTNLGITAYGLNQATDVRPDETFAPFRNHVERGQPYPTLTRRAQFYIDHPWFLEAGEELPCHKENPAQGGDYPLELLSGHNRWSSHSVNQANRLMLATHRGHPLVLLSPDDAAARSIGDGQEARVFNEVGQLTVRAKLAPGVRPGTAIIYNGWEPYQFRTWNGSANLEPGLVKWLGFAGGYGHLRYWPFEWQPVPNDRAVRVQVEPVFGPDANCPEGTARRS